MLTPDFRFTAFQLGQKLRVIEWDFTHGVENPLNLNNALMVSRCFFKALFIRSGLIFRPSLDTLNDFPVDVLISIFF
jgi:hypothetical protein